MIKFVEELASCIVPKKRATAISLLGSWLLDEPDQDKLIDVVNSIGDTNPTLVDLRASSGALQTVAALAVVLYDGNSKRIRGADTGGELDIEADPYLKLLN